MSEFEKCLRDGRRKLRISQRDLAERVGISTESIVMLESGCFAEASADQLLKIADIVGMDGHIFTQMYRSMFRSELNSRQTIEPHQITSMASAAEENQTDPDLLEIANSIMALPTEVKNNLLQIIKLLASTQMKGGAA